MTTQQFITLIQATTSELENVDEYQEEPEIYDFVDKEFDSVWLDR